MLCHNCSSQNSENARFCNACGQPLAAEAPRQPVSPVSIAAIQPPKKKTPIALVVILVILGLSVIGAIAGNSHIEPSVSAPDVATTPDAVSAPDTSWIPAGLSIYSEDPDLAWAFDNKSACSILGDNGCIHIKVVSNRVCASDLYVEANELDKAGNIIGMTNASLGHLSVGQVAKLELDSTYSQTASFQLAKIDCL
jgi:hypothetical protein